MMIIILVAVAAAVILLSLIGLIGKNAPLDKAPFRESWKQIIEKSHQENGLEIAIINADKLLDLALKKKRFKGETMGERLISAKNALSHKQEVWNAHKLRNRLVHEQNVRLDEKTTKVALKGFESALKDLGAL